MPSRLICLKCIPKSVKRFLVKMHVKTNIESADLMKSDRNAL